MMIEPVSHWGKGAPRRKSKSAVAQALAMNRKPWICDACGAASATPIEGSDDPFCRSCGDIEPSYHRRRIFSLSLGDIWDAEVPIAWLAEMLDTIRSCDQVTWILCSKRWENFFERTNAVIKSIEESDAWGWGIRCPQEPLRNWLADWQLLRQAPPNIIGLCSVEDQQRAEERIPQFVRVPLACRGLSLEPLLGPVDLTDPTKQHDAVRLMMQRPFRGIDWIIIGGESGPQARPCNLDWIRSLVAQGKAAGVATFCKQLGSNSLDRCGCFVSEFSDEVEKAIRDAPLEKLNLMDKKGADPSEWPLDLRVQQWPEGF